MAYIKCLAGGGGNTNEGVTLWENPETYDSENKYYAGTTTETLNDSISNYDFIQIDYLNNQDMENAEGSVLYPVDIIKTFLAGAGHNLGIMAYLSIKNYFRYRTIEYTSDTELTFYYNNASQATRYCIPMKIIGIKLG